MAESEVHDEASQAKREPAFAGAPPDSTSTHGRPSHAAAAADNDDDLHVDPESPLDTLRHLAARTSEYLEPSLLIAPGLALLVAAVALGLRLTFALLLCATACIGGVLVMAFGLAMNERAVKRRQPQPKPRRGLPSVLGRIAKPEPELKVDRRLTGSVQIDTQLNEVIELLFRDYVLFWYAGISSDDTFIRELKNTNKAALIRVATASKEMDWVNFFTVTAVDEVLKHIRYFRMAESAVEANERSRRAAAAAAPTSERRRITNENILTIEAKFFELEQESRAICCSEECEKEYLRDLAEALLYILLPPSDFATKNLRFVIREIIAMHVLAPAINMFSDPDYINQTIALGISDEAICYSSILDVIRSTRSLRELAVILDNINVDVKEKLSSGNTEKYKNQLDNLLSAQKECERRKALLSGGSSSMDEEMKKESKAAFPFHFLLVNSTATAYFAEFMRDCGANHLLDFYLNIDAFRASSQQQLEAIDESATPEQRKQITEGIRKNALQIYFQNVADMADFPLPLPLHICSRLYTQLTEGDVTPTVFDVAQHRVYRIMQKQDFARFLLSDSYHHLCAALEWTDEEVAHARRLQAEMEKVIALEEEEADKMPKPTVRGRRPGQSGTGKADEPLEAGGDDDDDETVVDESEASAESRGEGGVKERRGLRGSRRSASSSAAAEASGGDGDGEDTSGRMGHRRSSFSVLGSSRPSMRSRTMSSVSMESSGSLDLSLKTMWKAAITSTILSKNPEGGKTFALYLLQVERTNLETGEREIWESTRRYSDFHDLHRVLKDKFGKLVVGLSLPGKRTFGNLSQEFLDKRKTGLTVWLDTLMSDQILGKNEELDRIVYRFLSPRKYERETLTGKLLKRRGSLARSLAEDSAGSGGDNSPPKTPLQMGPGEGDRIDSMAGPDEVKDDLTMRILLSIMDEIFELKANQWLRKRVVGVLRHLIRRLFGDSINRRILDNIENSTSTDQVAAFVQQFKDSWWPDGELAPDPCERSLDCKLRTRVEAKIKLFGIMPDQIRILVGNESAKRGILRIFEMLQYPRLNKRLVLALFEQNLIGMFPDNKLRNVLNEIRKHSVENEPKIPPKPFVLS